MLPAPPRHASRFIACLVALFSLANTVSAAPPTGAKEPAASPAAGGPPGLTRSLDVRLGKPGANFTLLYPDDWSVGKQRYRNALELFSHAEGLPGKKGGSARVVIMVEPQGSAQGALERLKQEARKNSGAEVSFFEVSGWPAVARTWTEAAKRGKIRPDNPQLELPVWLMTSVQVAVGDSVVRFHAEIPDRDLGKRDRVLEMTRAILLEQLGEPNAAQQKLEALRGARAAALEERSRKAAQEPTGAPSGAPQPGAALELEVEQSGASAGLVRNFQNFSEIEVAASTSGKHVVLATNGTAYSVSHDAGQTSAQSSAVPAYPRNGDPSVGFGQSGAFYFGFIAYPDGTGAPGSGNESPIDGCTTGIMGSTNNGDTFSHRGHAAWCPRHDPDTDDDDIDTCFPDQEHIAVDRWNPATGGEDQLYNTWRNFTPANPGAAQDADCPNVFPGFVDVLLTCSTDSGVTWNNGGPAPIISSGGPNGDLPVLVDPNGDFPRIAVGADGLVHVVYLTWDGDGFDDVILRTYESCAADLDLLYTAFLAPTDDIDCAQAGLDRCNDGNDLRSPTVTVDDNDPSHVFVGYASDYFTNPAFTSSVFICDSTDAGFSFNSCVVANNGTLYPRFMPWTCSVCGEAFVGWYDRRRSTVDDNSLTDYFLGRAKRDPVNGLLAGAERRITPTADSQCGPANDSDMWPSAPRSSNDSENCTQQPQLAGACMDSLGNGIGSDDVSQAGGPRCDFSDCGGANTLIDFGVSTSCQCTPEAGSPSDIYCSTGGGSPKYGDYNGIACAAGRVYAAYASATPPGGPQDPAGDIDSFLEVTNYCAPQMNVPGDVDFTGGCDGGTIEGTLNVCNTGKVDLEVDSISSSNAEFAVTTPLAGYPVVISPDFCFPFEVVFTSDGSPGTRIANLTINSNDPVNPAFVYGVSTSASAGVGNIVTTFAPGGSFGDVCLGSDKDLDLTIHNSGGCPLTVTNITSDNVEFEVGAVGTFPLVIEGGDSVMVPIQFDPAVDAGVESGNITIASDDPDTPSKVVAVTGNSPAAIIDAFIGDAGVFGNVCVEKVYKELPFTIQNNGTCPLDIDGVALTGGDVADFSLPVLPATTTLEPANSVVVPVRFNPTSFLPLLTRTTTVRVSGRTLLATTPLADDDTAVSGVAPPPDINVPAADSIQEFGNVCADVTAEKEIPVCNVGACNLNVTAAGIVNCPDGDFTIVQNPFPSIVSPDFCMGVVVRYTPHNEGEHTCQLRISSNDPDEADVFVTLHGTTPTTTIDVSPDQAFLPEVVSSVDVCESRKPFPVTNRGLCPLAITDISILDNPTEYGVEGTPPSYPHNLQPGHSAGDGDLNVIFGPDQPLDRDKLGTLRVSYVSDAILGTITNIDRQLCGEGVLTGARVLVTNNGTNVGTVERIQLQRVVGNRNRRPQLDTVSVWQNVTINLIDAASPCTDFYYHVEWGTVWNPVQLLPGYYQVTATIKVGTKKYTKTVGFSVNSCDFNPSVIVTFNTP